MMAELRLSDFQMGLAFSAFALAYGIFEVPMGCRTQLSRTGGHRRKGPSGEAADRHAAQGL